MFFVEGWGCFGWFVGQIRGEKLKRRRTNFSCYVQFYVLLHCLFFLFTTECVFVHISVPLFCTCVTISKCICVCNCKRMRVLLYLFLTVSVKSWRRRGRKKNSTITFSLSSPTRPFTFCSLIARLPSRGQLVTVCIHFCSDMHLSAKTKWNVSVVLNSVGHDSSITAKHV